MAKRKKPADAAKEWPGKPVAAQVRGSPEWKAWLERLAAFDRSTVADVIDRATAAYARTVGFAEAPPAR
jgi:hypothetical protein